MFHLVAALVSAVSLQASPLPGALLIADRGNNRILVVDPQGGTRLAHADGGGRRRRAAAALQRRHLRRARRPFADRQRGGLRRVVSVDIRARAFTTSVRRARTAGGGRPRVSTIPTTSIAPDGSFTVADTYNCRILFVRNHAIVRPYGHSGLCRHDPPPRFEAVNGDTPTPYGGILVSEIPGHWIDSI